MVGVSVSVSVVGSSMPPSPPSSSCAHTPSASAEIASKVVSFMMLGTELIWAGDGGEKPNELVIEWSASQVFIYIFQTAHHRGCVECGVRNIKPSGGSNSVGKSDGYSVLGAQ